MDSINPSCYLFRKSSCRKGSLLSNLFCARSLPRIEFNIGILSIICLLTSHRHRHGELFEVYRIPTGELLRRSIAYDNAPLDQFNPPLKLTAGDGLRFECTHANFDTDTPIRYGVTSEDEMAIMFGFYYLSVTQ